MNVLHVLGNDELDGMPASLATVSLARVQGDVALSMNADGSINVAKGTLPGTYTLAYRICELANPSNCDEAVVQVTVVPASLRISNVLTPNGDGYNDYFEIEGIEGFDRVEVTVVSRWGQEVYHSAKYGNDWNGGNLGDGTFYYRVTTYRGSHVSAYSGWVLIKRQ